MRWGISLRLNRCASVCKASCYGVGQSHRQAQEQHSDVEVADVWESSPRVCNHLKCRFKVILYRPFCSHSFPHMVPVWSFSLNHGSSSESGFHARIKPCAVSVLHFFAFSAAGKMIFVKILLYIVIFVDSICL